MGTFCEIFIFKSTITEKYINVECMNFRHKNCPVRIAVITAFPTGFFLICIQFIQLILLINY